MKRNLTKHESNVAGCPGGNTYSFLRKTLCQDFPTSDKIYHYITSETPVTPRVNYFSGKQKSDKDTGTGWYENNAEIMYEK